MSEIDEFEAEQPRINIGLIGHVADGKTTFVKAVTNVSTLRHSSEKKGGKTLDLSYTNAVIYSCDDCPPPGKFQSGATYEADRKCNDCDRPVRLVRHFSFVDCPGHHSLVTKMLDGSSVMDAVIVVESVSNDEVPAPQTREHLIAAEIMGLPVLMVLLNKIDTLAYKRRKIVEKKEALEKFLPDVPIIPTCANFGYNIDVALSKIAAFPVPESRPDARTMMHVVRSFCVNKPGDPLSRMRGSVAGGSITCGRLSEGDRITIRPGIIRPGETTRFTYQPLPAEVESLFTERHPLTKARERGLIAVGMSTDPSLSVHNRMVGSLLLRDQEGAEDPPVYETVKLKYTTIHAPPGVDKEEYKIRKGDRIYLNCNSSNVEGVVEKRSKSEKTIDVALSKPICAFDEQRVALSKDVGGGSLASKRLIGFGLVRGGLESAVFS